MNHNNDLVAGPWLGEGPQHQYTEQHDETQCFLATNMDIMHNNIAAETKSLDRQVEHQIHKSNTKSKQLPTDHKTTQKNRQ